MSTPFAQGYALLIGVSENADPAIDDLAGVDRDIDALERVLGHPQRCAYPLAQVRTVKGWKATRVGIRQGLEWLREQLAADRSGNATVVLYYSGHGHRIGDDYYLVPHDAEFRNMPATALKAVEFAAAVAAIRPQRLFLALDCCHAAGMGAKGPAADPGAYRDSPIPVALFLGGPGAPGSVPGKGPAPLDQGQGRAVISSCQPGELSYMRADGTMSLFTAHLVEALEGAAQPAGGAGEVLVSDVVGHIERQVLASAAAQGLNQHPDYQLTGNFPLARIPGGKGGGADAPAPPPGMAPAAAPAVAQQISGNGNNQAVSHGGAIAQGPGAIAAGPGAVVIQGDHHGIINTGTITRR